MTNPFRDTTGRPPQERARAPHGARWIHGAARLALAIVAATPTVSGIPEQKILTDAPGAYRVRYEDLLLDTRTGPVESAKLSLSNLGSAVPIWVEDGGDGELGPGDWFEFVATRLPGELGYWHEYARYNVYVLRTADTPPARWFEREAELAELGPDAPAIPAYDGTLRLEVDTLLMRFPATEGEPYELWYWHKLSPSDEPGFTVDADLSDLDPGADGTVSVTVAMRGWSFAGGELPDHLLEVSLDGQVLDRREWDGTNPHEIRLEVPVERLRPGTSRIGLRIPRREDPQQRLLVDVNVLNWIEIEYPRRARLEAGAATVLVPGRRPRFDFELDATTAETVRAYGAGGTRVEIPADPDGPAAFRRVTLGLGPGDFRFVVATDSAMRSPSGVQPFHGGDLASPDHRADYILIAHPSLLAASVALAEHRRRDGLRVEVVDVQAIYDQFRHGIESPAAIRAFLETAYHQWTKPAPRFVLLVGDASWDSKHDRPMVENYAFKTIPLQDGGVGRHEGETYPDTARNDRGLIPTWNYFSPSGHSASDNWYVAVEGDDWLPDMAIGRLPVTTPAEVEAVVAKIRRYEETHNVGPWRRRALWITNEVEGSQKIADRVAGEYASLGYLPERIYPERGEEGTTDRILRALDEGTSIVYFYGHGGRNIWRTSPADLKTNRDLFSLSDIDRLKPSDKTPVVLSFTCYSAPFDHPSEDSIGEKFLRVADRGAVAFFGASWRNAPSQQMQTEFVQAIGNASTVGEAILAAKRRIGRREFVETYNLLGDPATRLRTTAQRVELSLERDPDTGSSIVRGTIDDERLRGDGLLAWVAPDGTRLHVETFRATDARFEVRATAPLSDLPEGAELLCYVWSAESGLDGYGVLRLRPDGTVAEPDPRPDGDGK